jgi:hypothetical protein
MADPLYKETLPTTPKKAPITPDDFSDVIMEAWDSPYKPTPPTTPNKTPSIPDDFTNVDMDAWNSPFKPTPQATPKHSPDSPARFTAAQKEKHRAISPSRLSIPLPAPVLPAAHPSFLPWMNQSFVFCRSHMEVTTF